MMYTQETIHEALRCIKAEQISVRYYYRYKVPEGLNNSPMLLPSPSSACKWRCSHLIAIPSYGFPLTKLESRLIVGSYLNRIRRKVTCFKNNNNILGDQWMNEYFKRHFTKHQINQRVLQRISRYRAALSAISINQFFDHLQKELDDIDPEKIRVKFARRSW